MSFKILKPQSETKYIFVLGQNKLAIYWLVWERKKQQRSQSMYAEC